MTAMIRDVQIVKNGDTPVAAVLPWPEYQRIMEIVDRVAPRKERTPGIPQQVMELVYLNGDSPVKAWRKYLKLTQKEAAAKAGITQAAFSQIEKARKCQKDTLHKLAGAFEIAPELLDMID